MNKKYTWHEYSLLHKPTLLGFQPHYKAAILGVKTIEFFLEVDRGEKIMLSFLTTNMAALTSHANQQCKMQNQGLCIETTSKGHRMIAYEQPLIWITRWCLREALTVPGTRID